MDNSLYAPTLEASFDDPNIAKNEPAKMRIMRIVNLVALLIFAVAWSLNFIWCGWAGAYAALMIYSLICGILNGLFHVGKHHQRLIPFNLVRPALYVIYGLEAIALGLSLAFLVVGSIGVSNYPPTGSGNWISPAAKLDFLISKFQIAVSIIFGLHSLTFTAYLREFYLHYVEGEGAGMDLSDSEKKQREESLEEEEDRLNTQKKYEN